MSRIESAEQFKEHISALLDDVKHTFKNGFKLLEAFRDAYEKPRRSLILRKPEKITNAANIEKRRDCVRYVFEKMGSEVLRLQWLSLLDRVKHEEKEHTYVGSLNALAELSEQYYEIWKHLTI